MRSERATRPSRGLLAAAACLTLTTVSACSSSSPASSSLTPAKGATIVLPQQTAVPPWAFVDAQDKLVGLLPDMSAPIAEAMGMTITNEQTTWENSLLGLDQGKYVAAPGADVTPERLKKYDFVITLKDGYGFQVRPGAPDIAKDMQALCGLKVGLPASSSPIPTLEDESKKCEANSKQPIQIQTFADWASADLAAQSGQVDTSTATISAIQYQASQNPGKWKVTGPTYNEIQVGYAVKKGDPIGPKLVDAVNAMIANGKYLKILQAYGTNGMAVEKSKLVTG